MSDLVAVLRAAIEARLQLAREATPGPWEHVDYASPYGQPMTKEGLPSTFMGCGSVITLGDDVAGGDIAAPNGDLYPRSGYSPSEDMAHIAANDPSTVERHCLADLRRLERHTGIHRCVGGNYSPPDDCEAVADLAEAYGVNLRPSTSD